MLDFTRQFTWIQFQQYALIIHWSIQSIDKKTSKQAQFNKMKMGKAKHPLEK